MHTSCLVNRDLRVRLLEYQFQIIYWLPVNH